MKCQHEHNYFITMIYWYNFTGVTLIDNYKFDLNTHKITMTES